MPDDHLDPSPGPRLPPPAPPWGQPWASPPPPGTTPPPRWRPRRGRSLAALIALGLGGLGAALGGWLSTNGSSSSAASADAVRLANQSLAAALASGSFHYVSTSASGGVTQLTVGDAGPTSGRQAITIGPSSFDVVVVGAGAYLRGDTSALEQNLFLPSQVAGAHAGQWISLASGDAPYSAVYAAVKTPDALHDNLTFTPQTELGPSRLGNQPVLAVQGPVSGGAAQGVTGTATLYFQAGGRHLPVRYTEQGTASASGNSGAGGGGPTKLRFRIDFSNWGQPVSLAAPTGVVAFSSLGVSGAGPPGSTPSTVLT